MVKIEEKDDEEKVLEGLDAKEKEEEKVGEKVHKEKDVEIPEDFDNFMTEIQEEIGFGEKLDGE